MNARMTESFQVTVAMLTCLVLVFGIVPARMSHAASASEIEINVDTALERFYDEVGGAREFARSARGLLVFPKVYKAGLAVGGEYGEGALRIDGKTVDYYNTAAASIGLQIGAQSKALVLAFLEEDALMRFRASPGWEVGVDGSIAIVDVGTGGSIDTTNIRDPIVAFVFDHNGLMGNITLEGSKFTRIEK